MPRLTFVFKGKNGQPFIKLPHGTDCPVHLQRLPYPVMRELSKRQAMTKMQGELLPQEITVDLEKGEARHVFLAALHYIRRVPEGAVLDGEQPILHASHD